MAHADSVQSRYIREYEDIVTLTMAGDTMPLGPCRAIRCLTAGTIIGLTKAGNSRTITMAANEVLAISFRSVTGGNGTFQALY
jgi:hypothetical protein